MSVDLGYSWPWKDLDSARLAQTVKEVVEKFGEGVVCTRDPERFDPDPDAYVRPGFEDVDDNAAASDDEHIEWHFGFPSGSSTPSERYLWCTMHFYFQSEDSECAGYFSNHDYDERVEADFLDLATTLVEALGGEMHEG